MRNVGIFRVIWILDEILRLSVILFATRGGNNCTAAVLRHLRVPTIKQLS